MANRQDSGSNSAHENQRPHPHNEDRLPENTDQARGLGEPDAVELDDEADMDDEEDEEGSF
ncbi:MAG TPA: hypothetical protein VM364_02990 [Vicinamibacterales bacterium]|nr:hypothetical protein [Vicinamibacterales bacterium]